VVKPSAPLHHLVGERITLTINAVATGGVLQYAGDDCAQLELDLIEPGAALSLVLNVLANRFAKRGKRYERSVGGSPKSAVQLFRQRAKGAILGCCHLPRRE
jgi:hypothetical protein